MPHRKYETLEDAINLASFAHSGQLDKAGLPYINHPLRVMETVKAMGVRPYVQIAAVLHDVVEDTRFTIEILQALGVPIPALSLVRTLSRNCLPELDYYERIRANPDALKIKLADISDNTQAWRLEYLPKETQEHLLEKYAIALSRLRA